MEIFAHASFVLVTIAPIRILPIVKTTGQGVDLTLIKPKFFFQTRNIFIPKIVFRPKKISQTQKFYRPNEIFIILGI